MNLAIEYLVRTGVIKEFLRPPCTLFMNCARSDSRVAVNFLDCEPGVYKVRHWKVNEEGDYKLPPHDTYFVRAEDVFESNRVFLPDHFPMPYFDEPADTSTNRYNHPMSKDLYESYYNNCLNSDMHKLSKEMWLWNSFVKVYFHQPLRHTDFSDLSTIRREQRWIRTNSRELWSVWTVWSTVMLSNRGAAPELIFSSFFASF